MRTLWQDLRYGARMLLKQPGFTLIAMLTLALGIGANTAIFSVIHTLLIQPLPYRDADRVLFVMGWDLQRDEVQFQVSAADFHDWRGPRDAFEQTAGYRYWSVNLTGGDQPERVQGYRVTADLFALLGVEPLLGRAFLAGEDRPGAGKVVVLSHGLWQRRFGAERGVIGRTVTLNDESYTVVGVMPPKFEFPQLNFKGDLWAPFDHDAARLRTERDADFSMVAVARLRPDKTLKQAQAEMNAVYQRLAAAYPQTNAGTGVRLTPMQEMLTREIRPALLALLAAAGFVLLIACANVANLLLARARARVKEMALRAALGATAWRVARQLLTESFLLALAGGGLGVLLGMWTLDAIRSILPEHIVNVMPAALEIGINARVLIFALAASLLTSLVFGLVPALRLSRHDLTAALKEGEPVAGSWGRRRAGSLLVIAEVALSALLLVGAGLTLRSLWALFNVNPGFDAANLWVMDISLPRTRYANAEQRSNFYREALGRLAALPGVEAVGAVNTLPLSTSNESWSFVIEGRPAPAPGDAPSTDYRVISPDYFRALGIRLQSGRQFTAEDNRQALPVTIVNQAFVRRYFPNEEPVGKRIRFGGPNTPLADEPWRVIVGVVGDVKHWELAANPRAESYAPLEQRPRASLTLAVRSIGAPAGLAAAARRHIHALDANLPVYNAQTMEQVVARSLFTQRMTTNAMLIFGAVAMLLAGVGLFGLISYSVSRRTREIGIRMALGAQRGAVLRLIIRQGMKLALGGLVSGLAGALALSWLMKKLLFGVSATDPLTFALVAMLLMVVALLACFIPARRATKVDPMIALRTE